MIDYQRKLYGLLNHCDNLPQWSQILDECFNSTEREALEQWWQTLRDRPGSHPTELASSSDRINLHATQTASRFPTPEITICHPISGQFSQISSELRLEELRLEENDFEKEENDLEKIKKIIQQFKSDPNLSKAQQDQQIFWWFWRFYPELFAQQNPEALLLPAHSFIPDCPIPSYASSVSALITATTSSTTSTPETPYLLLFTFSPIQEFIKASRKFVDFWAGSYLLHYLSAQLCWLIADQFGPDALIVPSLWSQEIIDAMMVKQFDCLNSHHIFSHSFEQFTALRSHPTQRFHQKQSTSLSTAGFPNVITALIPGKTEAEALGAKLSDELKTHWVKMGDRIRTHICDRVRQTLARTSNDKIFEEFSVSEIEREACERDLDRWRNDRYHWEWNKLWKEQLEHSWEPYWAAIPLGDPTQPLAIQKADKQFDQAWKAAQQVLSQAGIDLPADIEESVYDTLNVGTWWGCIQERLRLCLRAIKNTRTWQIPTAPGDRSTISGQFSAVHPSLNYTTVSRYGQQRDLRQGGGLPAESMRLFWFVMAKAYPGLFDGSEKLNALELTKRMAWQFGNVAESLGIHLTQEPEQISTEDAETLKIDSTLETQIDDTTQAFPLIDYERLIRFPNLSSIASARFLYDAIALENSTQVLDNSTQPKLRRAKPIRYWGILAREIRTEFDPAQRGKFASRTRCCALQIPKVDRVINNTQDQPGQNLNGVMFSSKWLAEDMNLMRDDLPKLRSAIDRVHQRMGFSEGSPSDWWAIILADGDGMGKYISGQKLQPYQHYLIDDLIDQKASGFDSEQFTEFCSTIKKRMGPATHIALNRALLDFSNRLVPYLAEQRYCGRVIYSGGDDVMVVLPLEDVPGFVRSLQAAWGGKPDPHEEFNYETQTWQPKPEFETKGDYWYPTDDLPSLQKSRPYFTMGNGATMSMGIVIAYKGIPLPTVLENLWEAEESAKKMPHKNGLCFRVIYGGGNRLDAMMHGSLLEAWWQLLKQAEPELSPVLYRLAEEVPKRADLSKNYGLVSKAARVVMQSRDVQLDCFDAIATWLDAWEQWAWDNKLSGGTDNQDLRKELEKDLESLLRFSAFWTAQIAQRRKWLIDD